MYGAGPSWARSYGDDPCTSVVDPTRSRMTSRTSGSSGSGSFPTVARQIHTHHHALAFKSAEAITAALGAYKKGIYVYQRCLPIHHPSNEAKAYAALGALRCGEGEQPDTWMYLIHTATSDPGTNIYRRSRPRRWRSWKATRLRRLSGASFLQVMKDFVANSGSTS